MCGRFGARAFKFDTELSEWVCDTCGKPTPSKGIVCVRGFTIDNEQSRFRRNETCVRTQCVARELGIKAGSYKPYEMDSKGFWWCGHCKRIDNEQLVKCPMCNCYFRGPRRYFPVDYECEACEW